MSMLMKKFLRKGNKMALNFEQKKEKILSRKKWEEDRIVVDRWYEIEDTDPDISTGRLACMVADDLGWNYEDVIVVMGYFSEDFKKLEGK